MKRYAQQRLRNAKNGQKYGKIFSQVSVTCHPVYIYIHKIGPDLVGLWFYHVFYQVVFHI